MNAGSLHERLVVVTGASRGIGRAICLRAAEEGARLLVVARSAADLEVLGDHIESSGGSAEPLVVDLAESDAPDRIHEAVSARDLAGLIHSAGVCELGPVAETSPEALDRNWVLNLRLPYLLTARLLPQLKQARGHVVFINSGAGKVAKAGWSAYAASKHGLKALADALREEVGPDGVRVTTLYPGRTATDMQAKVHAFEGKNYDPAAFVRPDDVARSVITAMVTDPPALVEEISIRPMPR